MITNHSMITNYYRCRI